MTDRSKFKSPDIVCHKYPIHIVEQPFPDMHWQADILMMVADALVQNRHHAICNCDGPNISSTRMIQYTVACIFIDNLPCMACNTPQMSTAGCMGPDALDPHDTCPLHEEIFYHTSLPGYSWIFQADIAVHLLLVFHIFQPRKYLLPVGLEIPFSLLSVILFVFLHFCLWCFGCSTALITWAVTMTWWGWMCWSTWSFSLEII